MVEQARQAVCRGINSNYGEDYDELPFLEADDLLDKAVHAARPR